MGGRGARSSGGTYVPNTPEAKVFKYSGEKSPAVAVANSNAQNFSKGWEYQYNCQRCVWAYELQRRGYDVEALPTFNGDDMPRIGNWLNITTDDIAFRKSAKKLFDPWNDDVKSHKTEVNNATRIMSEWGEGSRGVIAVGWRNGGGHAFNVEYKNGAITAYDAQPGYTMKLLDRLKGGKIGSAIIYRTDNVVFDEKKLSKFVKQR